MNNFELKVNELYNKFLFEQDENTKIEYATILKSLKNNIPNKNINENIDEYFEELDLAMLFNIKRTKIENEDLEAKYFEKVYLNDSKSFKIITSLKNLIFELDDSINNNDFVFNSKDFSLIYEYIKDNNDKFSNFIRNELKNIFYINQKDFNGCTLANCFNKDHIYIIGDMNKNMNSVTLHEITHGYDIMNGEYAIKSINNEISPILVQHSFEEFTYTDLNILKQHVESYLKLFFSDELDVLSSKDWKNYKYVVALLFSIVFNYKYGHNIKTVSKAVDKLITYYDKSFEFLMNDFSINEDDLKYSVKEYTKKIRRD